VSHLRRISTQRLILLCAALLATVAAGAAIAIAATSGGEVPEDKPLANAVHDALSAPAQDGVTARVEFTNHLVDNVDFDGWNPIIGGGSGRLWATDDGKFRLELQSSGGDAQIVSNGKRWWAYDGESDTLYQGRVPQHEHKGGKGGKGGKGRKAKRDHEYRAPSVARIQKVINRVMKRATVDGPNPTNVAGEPAYSVRTSLKRNSGLLGGLEFAWDAATGAPLRGAVYAKGESDPVLALEATEIEYGDVPADTFEVPPPPDTKVENVDPDDERGGKDHKGGKHRKHGKHVMGEKRVERRVGFDVSAPAELEGRKREIVALVGKGGKGKDRAALVTYGRSLNGIAVIQKRVTADDDGGASPIDEADLPTFDVNGVAGRRLSTPLGGVVKFERNGISYTVIASAEASVLEAAARGL
jgi:outer membrane lipoprotein-sorting protein